MPRNPPAAASKFARNAIAKARDTPKYLKGPSTVVIAHRKLTVSRSVLDSLFTWMAERDRIRKRRFAGQPAPWSDDPVFINHKFCHVFRIYDRGTQFVVREVINKHSQDHRELCFRVILFKLFNRISTWQLLERTLGPLSWDRFDLQAYEGALATAHEHSSIYTGAYQIPAPQKLGDSSCFQKHLLLLKLMMDENLPEQLLRRKHMRDAYELIRLYPGMGSFLSYQLLLDLNMTPHLSYPENEWASYGPGSRDCLEKIFGKGVRGIESDAIAYLYATQDEHFKRLHIADPPSIRNGLPGVSFVDIEHSLCECSKYAKRKGTEGTWEASEEPVTEELPAKWIKQVDPTNEESNSLVDRAASPITELEDEDEDTYEVSHIVAEDSSGALNYKVRWTGYSPNWDTWESEANLKSGASDVLSEWRALRLAKESIDRRVAEIIREGSGC